MEKQLGNDEKIEEWRKWIEKIHTDVTNLNDSKQYVDELARMNIERVSFFEFFNRSVWTYLVMSVRREVDKSDRYKPQSFINLLSEFFKHPDLISKKWFLEQYDYNKNLGQDKLNNELSDFFDSEGKINPEVVHCDMGKLICRTREMKKIADKWVAHRDRHRKRCDATPANIENALSILSKLVQKYNLLLNQDGREPISTIGDNWQRIFKANN